MIREISRQQIDFKTAQGERVVLIEAQPGANYESRHIPTALPMPITLVRHLAMQYLPDAGAEIVVYGQDERSTEVDDVARQLSLLGYNNLYVYRGGKRDWFGAGEFSESVHWPPESGTHVRFADSPGAEPAGGPHTGERRAAERPLLLGALAVAALYAGLRAVKALLRERERFRGTDEVSGVPPLSPSLLRVVRVEQDAEFEGTASGFDAASAAE